MAEAIIHRCRFYRTELYSINALSYNEKLQKVAVLRKRIRRNMRTGVQDQIKIEIWNIRDDFSVLEQTIYDDPRDSAQLESIVWSKSGELYGCGLNTYLNAYSFESENISHRICVNSSALWCMNLNREEDLMALGTENGHAVLIRVFKNSFQFESLLNNFNKRILCLEWFYPQSGDSTKLVGGSIDNIIIWDVKTKNILEAIRVGNTGILVWCVKVLSDFTIISGDSKGVTSFWNGKLATKNCGYNSHNGDVLAISVSQDETEVCSAGIDPKVMQFQRNYTKTGSWVPSVARKPHTHDIRALQLIKSSVFISGGVDSMFCISSFTQHHNYAHLANFAHKMAIIKGQTKNYAIISYERQIQLHILGAPESDELTAGEYMRENTCEVNRLNLAENSIKLLQLDCRKFITTVAFNENFFVYAHYGQLKVYAWNEDGIKKIKVRSPPIGAIHKIVITDENVILACHGKNLEVYKIFDNVVVAERTHTFNSRIHDFVVCGGVTAISLADQLNSIIFRQWKASSDLKVVANPSLPTTFKFDDNGKLWIAYPNALIAKFDLDTMSFIDHFSLIEMKMNQNQSTKKFNWHWPIKHIAFIPNGVLFANDNYLCCLNVAKRYVTKADAYRHVLFIDNLDINQLVLFEATPESIFYQLPPSLTGNSFGS